MIMKLTVRQFKLLQYINTIANNGVRLKLSLMNSIKKGTDVVATRQIEELNRVNLEEKYLKRNYNFHTIE